jgi:hypothetical protein
MFLSRAISTNDGEISCPPQTYDYTERYVPRSGSMVYGYPSFGGVLVRAASAVELLHLRLDRFKEAKRSLNTAKEDEFCKRLSQIGATWRSSKAEWSDALIGEGDTAKMAKIVEVGWPSSGRGVWVLEYLEDDREMSRGASLLNLCLNMDERCKIIQELGGTFYSDADTCTALRPLLEEASR